MSTYSFSAIADNSVLAFNAQRDLLWFDLATLSAAELHLSVRGNDLQIVTPTKSFFLAGATAADLGPSNLVFADGSQVVGSSLQNGFALEIAASAKADLLIGSAAPVPMRVASVSITGTQGYAVSYSPSLSADGRHVAFLSEATNLGLSGFIGQTHAYVKDMLTGAVTLLSGTGNGVGNQISIRAVMSGDGRFAAFDSYASNLVAVDTNGTLDVFVKNLATGAVQRVSTSSGGGQAGQGASQAAISFDGQFIAFTTYSGDLVPLDSNGVSDVFIKNLVSGELRLVSTGSGGELGNSYSEAPKLSANGRYVVFDSYADNLVQGDSNGYRDVFWKDMLSGQTVRVSTGAAGVQLTGSSSGNAISADGRLVAFVSAVNNIVAGDTNNTNDIFVKDLFTGELTLVSSTAAGTVGNSGSTVASISGDGRYVSFYSLASNLVEGDTNGTYDVFVKDLLTGAIARISASAAGVQGNDQSFDPAMSADGSVIAFTSGADNLVPGDGNGFIDVIHAANPLHHLTLSGGAGNDTYLIQKASDQIVEAAGGGIDLVRASVSYTLGEQLERIELQGEAHINATGNALANTLTGNAGDNLLDGGAGTDTVSYANALEAVTVDLDTSDQQDTGGAGLDTLLNIENLTGSAFDDYLFGNAGANGIDGGAGADVMVGGDGNDSYRVDNALDQVLESAGAGSGVDTVLTTLSLSLGANLENLTLLGAAHRNATGNALANVLMGNRGSNVLDGGAGIDTVSYANALAAVKLGLDRAGPQSTGGAGADTLVSIENLTGSNFADTLHGNAGTNVLNGGAGIDTLSYARASAAVTLSLALTTAQATGGAGSDTVSGFENLTGSAFADTLTGSTAANVIDGGLGNDTLTGGAGNDSYLVDSTQDSVVELAAGGTDTVTTSVSLTLYDQVENGVLGGSAAINLTGNALANVLMGNGAANVLNGGAGFDTASYANATAAVTASLLSGTATGGGGSDSLVAIEFLVGSAFADTLIGSAGTNMLTGGAGADTLTGGGGNDSFVFNAAGAADLITDFSAGDKLRFSRSGFSVGDGDLVVEGTQAVAGPGGFASTAELVIFSNNAASLSLPDVAAVIGSASTAYVAGRTALFAVDDGASTGLYFFTSSAADSLVSASELVLVGSLQGYAASGAADFVLVA